MPDGAKSDLNQRPSPLFRQASAAPPGAATDFLKEQIFKQEKSNFHSSSLNSAVVTVGMSKPVNKTSLHPSGVQ